LPDIKDYYTTLGLNADASAEDLKKAYKRRALETHPDSGGNQEDFLKVQEAWEVLSGKRPPPQEHIRPTNNYNWQQDFTGFDFQNFGFNPFESVQQQENRPPSSDSGVRVTLQSNIEEIKQGKIYRVKYNKSVDCSYCNGKGAGKVETCSPCQGQGMLKKEHQQGMFYFVQNVPCSTCSARGKLFTDPCKICDTKGYILREEKLVFKFEVIEEK